MSTHPMSDERSHRPRGGCQATMDGTTHCWRSVIPPAITTEAMTNARTDTDTTGLTDLVPQLLRLLLLRLHLALHLLPGIVWRVEQSIPTSAPTTRVHVTVQRVCRCIRSSTSTLHHPQLPTPHHTTTYTCNTHTRTYICALMSSRRFATFCRASSTSTRSSAGPIILYTLAAAESKDSSSC